MINKNLFFKKFRIEEIEYKNIYKILLNAHLKTFYCFSLMRNRDN